MIRIYKLLALSVFLLSAGCSAPSWQKEFGVDIYRYSKSCDISDFEHWLIDLRVFNGKDSMYLNTATFTNKLEIRKTVLDTTSAFYKMLATTCVGDSLKAKLSAKSFYEGAGGEVPIHLKDDEIITVEMHVQDALNSLQYVAYKKAFEIKTIERYASKFNWNGVKDVATGIYYEKLIGKFGEELGIKSSSLNFSIKSLNDKMIMSTAGKEPFKFDSEDEHVLLGIQFLARRLGEGAKVRALVPSDAAYGPDGIPGKVSGFLPILIEMECLKVYEKN